MSRGLNALACAGLLLASQPALASTQIFNLSVDGSTTGLGIGPFGSVQVTENAGGTLTFVETLAAGYRLHAGNTNHNAFAFKITNNPDVTVTGLTSGFSATSLSALTYVTAPPFGTFFTAIACGAACGPGYPGGYAGPLTFTLGAAGGLTLASLGFNVYNNQNIFFTSDFVNELGQTGNVGAVLGDVPAVPEPSTWAMMLVGFAFAGYSLRRRKDVSIQVA